jgi:hypothetical protein
MNNNKALIRTQNLSQKINNTVKLKTGSTNPKLLNYNEHIVSGYKIDTDPFQYPITLTIIAIICIIFISYTLYNYYSDNDQLNIGKSFYGKDIYNYVPLFEDKVNNIDECQERCIRDPSCKGVTFNNDTKLCIGSEEGVLREEEKNYSSWIKPRDSSKIDFKTGILLSYADKPRSIDKYKFISPGIKGDFCFSFSITITDFYDNFGSWRHVFHKGTSMKDPNSNDYINDYKNWENVISDYPDQCIGVWLAPYTNNMRICFTTISDMNMKTNNNLHAFIQKCNSLTDECYITDMPGGNKDQVNLLGDGMDVPPKLIKSIEYIENDLQNIPVNEPVHITLNFRINNVELYVNGRIVKISPLIGIPDFNDDAMYVMYPKSFRGDISKLSYYPQSIKRENIVKLVNLI